MATKRTAMVVNSKTTTPQFQTSRHHNLSFEKSDRRMQPFTEKRSHGYQPVRNLLANQEQNTLNQTYTIGSSNLRQSVLRQQRSGSMDSDFADYGHQISNTIAGIFPRSFVSNKPCRKPPNQSQTITRMLSSQLPLIENYSAERLCCQRPWTRTQYELSEFKKTLKQIN